MATAENWLNELKFKVSYGKKGNDAIFYNNTSIRNYYAYRDQYKATSSDGVIGLSIFQIGNPDLSWEKKRELNVGLEFGLFNRRITGSIDYYINTTSDLLYNKPQQPSTGKPYLPMNIGKLENRGIDLQLGIGIIQTPNVDWQLNMTASHYKNKILALDPSIKDGVIDGNYKLTVGKSVKDYYIRSFAGVDPKTGQALYWMDDNEGNKTKTAKHAEATRYFQNKTGIPDIYGGL